MRKSIFVSITSIFVFLVLNVCIVICTVSFSSEQPSLVSESDPIRSRWALSGAKAAYSGYTSNSNPYFLYFSNLAQSDQSDSLIQVIFPNGGEILSGEVTIEWTLPSSHMLEPIQYSVYYSADGYNWILIAASITERNFHWNTLLYEKEGTNFLIQVIAYGKSGGTEIDISDNPFSISNKQGKSDNDLIIQVLGIILSFIAISGVAGIGLGYILFNPKFRRKQRTFMDYIESNEAEFLTSIRNKVVIGLDNIKSQFIAEARDLPRLEEPDLPTEDNTLISIADWFPVRIRNDLRTEMKGRTVLTLIEIAYQEPSETNPSKLAKSLNIPLPTLSKEIKKLVNLQYVEAFISPEVLHDGRYRNFAITQKGFTFLSLLNDSLKIAIRRTREKESASIFLQQ